jgi:HD-GYP domain-containing protein (c-di-GMP phosphodiesterase class II)
MAKMAVALARHTGISIHKLPDLQLFAEFHDVGKIGIPDAILFKKGRLTPKEWTEMQKHCEIGFRIAQSTQDLVPIANLILGHHEWWNGAGYPSGLTGEDIPEECRILAIADAYDAMTNDRPYRQAMTNELAIQELRRGAGVQFDPLLVTKFIEVLAIEELRVKNSSSES